MVGKNEGLSALKGKVDSYPAQAAAAVSAADPTLRPECSFHYGVHHAQSNSSFWLDKTIFRNFSNILKNGLI